MARPDVSEYATFQETYISKVPDGDILDILAANRQATYNFFVNIPADKADYTYADNKWTIKQVLGHMIDTERILAYRLLRFARNDGQPIPGFDQDTYVSNWRHGSFEINELAEEFSLLRQCNMYLFKSINDEEKQRAGIACDNRVTVNALLYIISGHELHHIQILKEHYL